VDYWAAFGTFLEGRGARFRSPKPYPSNWMSWGLGRAGTQLLGIVNAKEILVGVDVDSRDHPSWYAKLHADRDETHRELGFGPE